MAARRTPNLLKSLGENVCHSAIFGKKQAKTPTYAAGVTQVKVK
jgi:hypothetical protein